MRRKSVHGSMTDVREDLSFLTPTSVINRMLSTRYLTNTRSPRFDAFHALPTPSPLRSEQLSSTPLSVFGIHLNTHRMNDERLIKLAVTHSNSSASLSSSSCVTN
jgi:hypothetical protein